LVPAGWSSRDGAFWDGVEALGGGAFRRDRRFDALGEAIEVMQDESNFTSAIAEVPARLATSSGGVGTRRVRWLDGA
jgi:hypothetical protein